MSSPYRLFIGGINVNTSLEELKGYFNREMRVEDVDLLTCKKTGKSKGYAVITCSSKKCFDQLLNSQAKINGENLTISPALEPTRTKQFGALEKRKIFISHLPTNIQDGKFSN